MGRDLQRLGLRHRREHDARRTFISLATDADVNERMLTWITHGPPKTVVDAYTSVPWRTLCRVVQALPFGAPRSADPQRCDCADVDLRVDRGPWRS